MKMYFPQDEYEGRWQRLYAEIARRGYETAVVFGRSAGTYERSGDIVYLTNFFSTHSGAEYDTPLWKGRGYAGAIFAGGEAPELHTDEADTPRDLVATGNIQWHWDLFEGVAKALVARGVEGRVAMIGSETVPIKYYRQLEKVAPGIEFVPEDDLVESVRRIKSDRELTAYREGGVIVSAGLDALFENLFAGRTEAEAAAEAAKQVISRGGSYHMIPVSHGDRIEFFCRNPLTGYSLDAPQDGDLMRGWVYGPIWQGYWLDPGRTTVRGLKPTDRQRELVERCAGIVDAVIDAIKPGVAIRDVIAVGDQKTEEAGGTKDQAGEMWPIYGHGVGQFWEQPWLGPDCLDDSVHTFEKNMVLGVEAFLAYDGVGSAGFEQNVIVTDSGTELLTTTPMVFWD
jgi:Xaa-Pro aminopeptidase